MKVKAYKLNSAFARNPLRDLPRNILCPCGSKLKFKKCCLPYTQEYIAKAVLHHYEAIKVLALEGGVAW